MANAVNTDVDVAQSAALDALGLFQSRMRRSPDSVHPANYAAIATMHGQILVGLPLEVTPIQAAVLLHHDPVTVACVIEYIVLQAVWAESHPEST
jgi:hypothetical protein